MPFSLEPLALGERYTRPQLADLWGYRGYQAIARGVVTPAGSRVILLFVTHIKQEALTQYNDYISGDYLYWEGEAGHTTDQRIAKAHQNAEEVHLFYREIQHTPFEYRGPLEIRRFIPKTDVPSQFVFRIIHDLGPADDVSTHRLELEHLPTTEREAVVKARVGQGEFRDGVLRIWKGCALTGVDDPPLLRASHIKPWRKSSNEERLNPYNGLLLLPQYDHLFDRGMITFDERGRLITSRAIEHIRPSVLGLNLNGTLRHSFDVQRGFLDYHRNAVFLDQHAID